MKKILITGSSSYIGISLVKWLEKYSDRYYLDTISLRDDMWKGKDFSVYDVVFHVAGLAHIKETKKNANLYYRVNRDLAYETAIKAKSEGVKQFIFLSSMSVYGIESGVIDNRVPLNPKSNYGKSKLEAEKLITSLGNDVFKIAIIRPPMIYGKGCKGNYQKLSSIAIKIPVFPKVNNVRSMIYIDNLCEFVRLLIDSGTSGLYFPQNEDYVCTSDMVRLINEAHGRRVWMTNLFNPLLKLFKTGTFNKVFGDLVYAKTMSNHNINNYALINLENSIFATENVNENRIDT